MSLLFCDGFEGYNVADVDKVWWWGATAPSCELVTGRFGFGKALQINEVNGGLSLDYKWDHLGDKEGDVFIIGFAFKKHESSPAAVECVNRMVGGSYQTCNRVAIGNSYLYVYRSDSIVYSHPIQSGKWYYCEWRLKIADGTAGLIQVKLNGSFIYNNTATDTKYSSAYGHAGFYFRRNGFASAQIDDVYIIHEDGSGLQDFLGDQRVDAILPNGAGNYSQMTPSAGSNYQCVDEDPLSTSDYNEADTDGEKDTYAFADVPTDIDDSNINAICLNTCAKRTVPVENVTLKNMLRTGSTDYYNSLEHSLGDTFEDGHEAIWEKDPSDSNPWTKAKINACEFGAELEKT